MKKLNTHPDSRCIRIGVQLYFVIRHRSLFFEQQFDNSCADFHDSICRAACKVIRNCAEFNQSLVTKKHSILRLSDELKCINYFCTVTKK